MSKEFGLLLSFGSLFPSLFYQWVVVRISFLISFSVLGSRVLFSYIYKHCSRTLKAVFGIPLIEFCSSLWVFLSTSFPCFLLGFASILLSPQDGWGWLIELKDSQIFQLVILICGCRKRELGIRLFLSGSVYSSSGGWGVVVGGRGVDCGEKQSKRKKRVCFLFLPRKKGAKWQFTEKKEGEEEKTLFNFCFFKEEGKCKRMFVPLVMVQIHIFIPTNPHPSCHFIGIEKEGKRQRSVFFF